MPPRIARSSVSVAAPKSGKNKNRTRNLDAYSIASHSAAEKRQVKQHRLGELLDDRPAPKRRRDGEDEEEDADVEELDMPKKKRRAALDDPDVEEGSDSSGNEWTLGGLAEDDEDSDLDSDEAFGESDEEKFEGFTFRGSSGASKPTKRKSREAEDEEGGEAGFDLNEYDIDGEQEDDFGEEGVDLATMLDDEDSEDVAHDEDGGESGSEEASASEGDSGEDSGEEPDDDERIARMRDRIEALDGNQISSKPKAAPQQNTLSVDDLLADLDPSAKKQFAAATKTKKRSERPKTLAAPLPKRQQDRINREVADKKAKERLDLYQDTVAQNRRAEFLEYPRRDPDQGEPMGKDKFLETKPRNELEANIQRIMEESGMAPKDGQEGGEDGEDALMKAEGLAEKKMDVYEVLRRRAELRRARELLFYEEKKAKRLSKIKSKSYRRVHRKDKARQSEKEREERVALGLDPVSKDERERQDRKRAEERMGTKHRESKWAKAMKQTNRQAWDEGARDSVNEDARRREELRRRVEGRAIGSDESDGSADDDDDDESDGGAVTLRQLDKLRGDANGGERRGLAGMKFMRDADARRKAANDEDVERLRRDLAIEDGDEKESDDEIDDQGLGRAIFGPLGKQGAKQEQKKKARRNALEEGSESEAGEDGAAEDGDDVRIVTERAGKADKKQPGQASKQPLSAGLQRKKQAGPHGAQDDESSGEDGPFAKMVAARMRKGRTQRKGGDDDIIPAPVEDVPEPREAPRAIASRPDAPPFLQKMHQQATAENLQADAGKTNGKTIVKSLCNGEEEFDVESDSDTHDPILTKKQRDTALQKRAFAADDVAATVAAEKESLIASEDEKETSSHLPGWGSWTGRGLSRNIKRANARQKHNPLFKTKIPGGVKREDRADRDLERVIKSEKGDRKGRKFLAGSLPHGFERGEEYERSLRRPVGAEWGTKEVVQRNTRPRVVVKKGTIVGPMEKPLI